MKKSILITLLLIPFLGFSQATKPIEGFLGIKFGSSRVAVIAALKAKGGTFDKANSDANSVAFNNINLGHRETGGFLVKFINDKAFECDFIFDPGADAKTLEYYYALVNDITDIYGPTTVSKATFKEPYSDKDSDMDKIVAIQSAEADYTTIWQSDNKNTISVNITEKLAVVLQYQDAGLVEIAVKNQKAKEKSDY